MFACLLFLNYTKQIKETVTTLRTQSLHKKIQKALLQAGWYYHHFCEGLPQGLMQPFFELDVSGSTGTEQNAHKYVGKLIYILFNRGGFFSPTKKQIKEFNMCPWHTCRYSLVYGWAGRKWLMIF